MKLISEAVAKWQLERLSSLIEHSRSRAKANKYKSSSLVSEHLNLADDYLDEAIAAMRYQRYDQASYACQTGFVQLGLAEFLLQHGQKIDQGIRAIQQVKDQKKDHRSEDEELTAYLASSLAEMKVAIEYSNCRVSIRSHAVLDLAMDYYNDSLKAMKLSEAEKSKNSAQAGLLCMLLAAELIGAENQMPLPGWRGLSNPMLVSSLRRATRLVAHLAETRTSLHRMEQSPKGSLPKEEIEKTIFLRKNWEKAYNEFLLSVQSLSDGSVSHAQALLKSALREMETCMEIIGIEDPETLVDEIEEHESSGERTAVTDVSAAITTIKQILEEAKMQRKESLLQRLEKVLRVYKEAQRNFENGHYRRAEQLAADALLELDLVRQKLHVRKQKPTNAHSV